MSADLLTILAVGLAIYLGAATPDSILPQAVELLLPIHTKPNHSTLISVLGITSIVMWMIALFPLRKRREQSRILCIAAAMIAAHGARLAWHPNTGSNTLALWGIAIFIAITGGIVTRATSKDSANDSATLCVRPPSVERPMTISAWFMFTFLAVCSATLFSYRLLDIPGEMSGFGTQAISAAHRLLHGEVALRDLVLYREMTQEECGNSLPYVLWHALFQLLFGGMSLTAARIACAAASWLSVLMMFRVGRHIGGPRFGLVSMAVYSAIPVTLFNARSEGIFGFSALLILTICDAGFLFLRSPSLGRAIIFGLCVPLVGYGIANIKFYLLSLFATICYVILRRKQIGLYARYAALTACVAIALIVPQLLNLHEVKVRVQGRGEHIFGGVLLHLAYLDPSKPTPFRKALEILLENCRYLGESIFGPWADNMTTLPGGLSVLFVIGLCLIISSPLAPKCVFLGLMFFAGYAAPLISIPIGWTRMLMVNIAQALVISLVWSELLRLIRASTFPRIGSFLCLIGVAISLRSAIPAEQFFFTQDHSLGHARRFIMEQPAGTVVFFTDRHESSGNFLRWNPPHIGRDSTAERPLIGIREQSVGVVKSLVENLKIPAVIISNESPSVENQVSSNWRLKRIHGYLWAMAQLSQLPAASPVVQVLEPTKLDAGSPVMPGHVAYTSARLFMTQILQKSPLSLEFSLESDLERVAIIARGRNSFSAPVDLVIDNGKVALQVNKHVEGEANSTWYYAPQLSSGTHTMLVQLQNDSPPQFGFIDDIVIIGTPRR